MFNVAVATLVLTIFCLKLANYVDPSILNLTTLRETASRIFDNTWSAISNLPFLNSCPASQRMFDVPGGYVCDPPDSNGLYAHIFTSYPLVGQGRETIFPNTDQGNMRAADDLLRGTFDLPRYPSVRLPMTPTWAENPYSAQYWRIEFYSLRPSLNLLYAFRTTHQESYVKRLLQLDLSFISAESKSPWAWSNSQAVAFRSMALVDTWWKLRQAHQLPEPASTAMLQELEKTGQFLSDPNKYDISENHGTTEAAALYSLAIAFPTLPHAREWLALAKQRFQWQLRGIIDKNGQLIENSPYYDFSTLEEYWYIYLYSQSEGQSISTEFASTVHRMLQFATYSLQPNSQLPLLGASLETTINYYSAYRQMAATDPQFLYVLTHGSQGVAPPANSVFFPSSALTIMRSGWASGPQYTRSTYLTYYAGRYRTAHSDLDALDVTLYGDGGDLLPDPGLYTYTPGQYHNYFHGTVSHNTVTVDGKSQFEGDGSPGPLITRYGITYQSAESGLYPGVTHRRLVMMLDPDHVLIVDQLQSSSVHTYQQTFHLFPGARLSKSGLTASGIGGTPRREVTIQQLMPGGITESDVINRRSPNPAGLCSERYGKLLPCYQINYTQRRRNAIFATLITIGSHPKHNFRITVSDQGRRFQVVDNGRNLGFTLGQSAAVASRAWATDPTPPPVRTVAVRAANRSSDWTAPSGSSISSAHAAEDGYRTVVKLTANSGSRATFQNDRVRLDLRRHNARLQFAVAGVGRLSELELRLSNNHWAKSVTMNLLNQYTSDNAGGYASIFIGPSTRWGPRGGWHDSAPGFDWARVDGIEITIDGRAAGGPSTTVSIGRLALLPAQQQGKAVFIFDDGYQSILPAASYMNRFGMPGNIAVIGKYVDYPIQDYLNVFQLKTLQNKWGWDMVNHTQEHIDAVQEYYDRHDLTGYAQDILQQAAWLDNNGLNSAPNWLIYPHGTTNAELERVVGRYYMFARCVFDGPDAYPYGDPHCVNDLEIEYPGDGESSTKGYTPPAEIISAARQAVARHMTLFLTFHRILSRPSDLPGYPLALFKKVVDGVRRSGIKVLTLSQLDRSNGIPVTNHIYVKPGRPAQITVQMSHPAQRLSRHGQRSTPTLPGDLPIWVWLAGLIG